jgi:hypothetical protein
LKALRELALLDLGLDEEDALEILRRLRGADSTGRLRSERTGGGSTCFCRGSPARRCTSSSCSAPIA